MLHIFLQAWGGRAPERRGSLLVEAMLGIVLFGVFATAAFGALLSGQESSQEGADRMRGMHYTQQALEIAKAIRDRDFAELVPGQHGYTLDENGQWMLSGSLTRQYGYTTALTINSIADEKIRAMARTTWKHGYHRSGATVLSVELTDWRNRAVEIGDWSVVTMAANVPVPGAPELSGVTVEDAYAFVTGGAAGAGLYIFDVSDDAHPFRVSSDFSLGSAARSPVVYRDRLYLLTYNSGDEILAYDIANPTSLNAETVPVATYNLPGGVNRGMALFRKGSVLYAGAQGDPDASELYALDISDPNAITLMDELNIPDDPTVFDIYASGIYAYLATSKDAQEMIVADISNPSAMSEHAAYNATDANDGLSVRASGTGFYLGRSQGSAIDEYLLVLGDNGVPSANLADTFGADMGSNGEGSVNAMTMDPVGCYAFMATDFSSKELQIRSARHKTVEEVAYKNLSTSGNGIFYNMMNDRLYMATSTGFHIFFPGAGGDCR
ncbi:MAG: hypothetical protein PHU04_03385 [Candidatus Peribacteraceae bacterium]|nr:hypothetical protein [Candidatus Peribacteraceae bacterium]